MINIEESILKEFLLNRRDKIGVRKYSGIGEIVSGFSLIITLLCSDFNEGSFISTHCFELLSWIIAVAILAVGLRRLIRSICNSYDTESLYNELVGLDENRVNEYNIVLIKNNQLDGRYLLFYSQRWKCKLFLNYKVQNSGNYNVSNEINSIATKLSVDTGIKCSGLDISYYGELESRKFSYGDKVEKKYKFYFYFVKTEIPVNMQRTEFSCNGNKFFWMSLNDMYTNKNIVKKNSDVLDFIRKKSSMA